VPRGGPSILSILFIFILLKITRYRLTHKLHGSNIFDKWHRDEFLRRALNTLMDNVTEIRADHKRDLTVEVIIGNMLQSRANLLQQVVQELRDEGLPVLKPFLSTW